MMKRWEARIMRVGGLSEAYTGRMSCVTLPAAMNMFGGRGKMRWWGKVYEETGGDGRSVDSLQQEERGRKFDTTLRGKVRSFVAFICSNVCWGLFCLELYMHWVVLGVYHYIELLCTLDTLCTVREVTDIQIDGQFLRKLKLDQKRKSNGYVNGLNFRKYLTYSSQTIYSQFQSDWSVY